MNFVTFVRSLESGPRKAWHFYRFHLISFVKSNEWYANENKVIASDCQFSSAILRTYNWDDQIHTSGAIQPC